MKLEQGWAFECGLCKQRGEPYASRDDAANGLVAHFDRCSSIYDGNVAAVRDELKRVVAELWTLRSIIADMEADRERLHTTVRELGRLEMLSHEIRDRTHPRTGLGDGERASLEHARLVADALRSAPKPPPPTGAA